MHPHQTLHPHPRQDGQPEDPTPQKKHSHDDTSSEGGHGLVRLAADTSIPDAFPLVPLRVDARVAQTTGRAHPGVRVRVQLLERQPLEGRRRASSPARCSVVMIALDQPRRGNGSLIR
eukprot:596922-Hanusia_phi.AAC.4